MFPPIIFSPQRQFANVLYVKYADVIWMMGIKLFKCEVLIDILCLDCGFLNVRLNLFLPNHRGCVLNMYAHPLLSLN